MWLFSKVTNSVLSNFQIESFKYISQQIMEDLFMQELVITLCLVARAHGGRVVFVGCALSVVLS